MNRLCLAAGILLVLGILISPVAATMTAAGLGYNITTDDIPLWFVFQYPVKHTMTGYNFTAYANFTTVNNSWIVLGSNNWHDFSILDERLSEPLADNVTRNFGIASPGAYVYYAIELFTGFGNSSEVMQVHLYTLAGEEATCATPAAEEGLIPMTFVYTLIPVAMGVSLYTGWSSQNRVYGNIILGGSVASIIRFFLGANVITGNVFYSSENKFCVVSDTPLFWIFILFGVMMAIYTLVLVVEAVMERDMASVNE